MGGTGSVYIEPGSSLIWGSGMIDSDPLFVDAGKFDFHLTTDSPCLDKGDNNAPSIPSTDFEGDPRIINGTVDMGPDEYTGDSQNPGSLTADLETLEEATGGTVVFTLSAGEDQAGRYYLLLGSISGTGPGIPLPGGEEVLPLHWDVFTDLVIYNLNSPLFMDFMGVLDAEGDGEAQFQTGGPLPKGSAGIVMTFAYALKGPWDFVSNPVDIKIVD
jgi:hypothetical protein